jgi:formylglycine-generating enzyme required for sulfatase activity
MKTKGRGSRGATCALAAIALATIALLGAWTVSCDNGSKPRDPADPTVTWPEGLTGFLWQTLADVRLPSSHSGGVAGKFSWVEPGTALGGSDGELGERRHLMRFTPVDTYSYNEVIGEVVVTVSSLIDMAAIPAGEFVMGSPIYEPGRRNDENPRAANGGRVSMSAFRMGAFPVTQAQYELVTGANPSYFRGKDLPVENVSWYDAIAFANRLSALEGLTPAYGIGGQTDPDKWGPQGAAWDAVEMVPGSSGYRLPTEAQWEYAARAGTTTAFNWGTDEITSADANFGGNVGETTPMGKYPANAWGLYDTHGNVWEWCWDRYAEKYDYAGAGPDPVGASAGSVRIFRGGRWDGSAEVVRSAVRYGAYPSFGYVNLGFRLSRPRV